MGTMQLQKTVNAETVTKTVIDQKQSLEVVQTMLHGGLSTLSYLRNFFAEKTFDRRIYDLSDRIQPYEDYAAGKLKTSHKTSAKHKTAMQVLQRNRSRRVDRFLDWLEHGAFPCLREGNLDALQVYVHADCHDRQKVIETYTFTIKYHSSAKYDNVPSGLQLDGQGKQSFSVGATNLALQQLLRDIMDLCATLPDLPEKRYISMALFYRDNPAKTQKPKGFVTAATEVLYFAEVEGWEKRTKVLNDLRSGFHHSSLKVSHLQPISQTINIGLPGLQPSYFPQELRYPIPHRAEDDLNLELNPEDSADASYMRPLDGVRPRTESLSTIAEPDASAQTVNPLFPKSDPRSKLVTPAPKTHAVGHEILHRSLTAVDNAVATHLASVNPPYVDNSLDTQSSNIPRMRTELNAMMRPEHISQGDTQLEQQFYPDSMHSQNFDTQTHVGIPPSKLSEHVASLQTSAPMLSQAIAEELEGRKESLRRAARHHADDGKNKMTGEVVFCQCGYNKDEGDMVNCTYCDTWQHVHCYGYSSSSDERLPTDHVCYLCLLEEGEENTLEKLCDLIQKRRAMHVVLEKGLRNPRTLAAEMDIDPKSARSLYDYLIKERFVVSASGSRRTGKSSSGQPSYVAHKTGPNQDKMLRTLFDPMMHVRHMYDFPSDIALEPQLPKQSLMPFRLNSMLPPITPASRLKRSVKARTMELDLRASMTPFHTPSRPRSHQQQLLKRSADAAETASTPNVKRLRSVQSEFLLDAGGLSSSPAVSVS